MTSWFELKADTYRLYASTGWRRTLKGFLFHRTFRAIVSLRLCQAAAAGGSLASLWLPIFKILHRFMARRAGMDLPWETRIGAGIALTHGWGMVVNPGARIGSNVTLFHGVTIGQRDQIANDGTLTIGYPVIENEVWIGPHAVVVGGITIGRGSRICAGAFVTDSVPPFAVVVGNPASVVKSGCTPDVMNRFEMSGNQVS